MIIQLDYDSKELKRVGGNPLKDFKCFEVEIIKNVNRDTNYRIELMDNNYLDITLNELKILKRILNNDMVTKLLQLDTEVK